MELIRPAYFAQALTKFLPNSYLSNSPDDLRIPIKDCVLSPPQEFTAYTSMPYLTPSTMRALQKAFVNRESFAELDFVNPFYINNKNQYEFGEGMVEYSAKYADIDTFWFLLSNKRNPRSLLNPVRNYAKIHPLTKEWIPLDREQGEYPPEDFIEKNNRNNRFMFDLLVWSTTSRFKYKPFKVKVNPAWYVQQAINCLNYKKDLLAEYFNNYGQNKTARLYSIALTTATSMTPKIRPRTQFTGIPFHLRYLSYPEYRTMGAVSPIDFIMRCILRKKTSTKDRSRIRKFIYINAKTGELEWNTQDTFIANDCLFPNRYLRDGVYFKCRCCEQHLLSRSFNVLRATDSNNIPPFTDEELRYIRLAKSREQVRREGGVVLNAIQVEANQKIKEYFDEKKRSRGDYTDIFKDFPEDFPQFVGSGESGRECYERDAAIAQKAAIRIALSNVVNPSVTFVDMQNIKKMCPVRYINGSDYYFNDRSQANVTNTFPVCAACFTFVCNIIYEPYSDDAIMSNYRVKNSITRIIGLSSESSSGADLRLIQQYSANPLSTYSGFSYADNEKPMENIESIGVMIDSATRKIKYYNSEDGMTRDPNLYLGIELEVTPNRHACEVARGLCSSWNNGYARSVSTSLAAMHARMFLDRQRAGILKFDGSVQGGFEIVTVPGSFQWHMTKAWDGFFKEDYPEDRQHLAPSYWLAGWINNGTEITDPLTPNRMYRTPFCGIHIHVSKDALTHLQLSKIVCFVNHSRNKQFMHHIAGRGGNNYQQYSAKNMKIGYRLNRPGQSPFNNRGRAIPTSRYEAINLSTNKPTIEFRIFRSNVAKHGFFKNIEFVHALVTWAKHCKIDAPLSDFLAYVVENRSTYKYLTRWLVTNQYVDIKHFNLNKNIPLVFEEIAV